MASDRQTSLVFSGLASQLLDTYICVFCFNNFVWLRIRGIHALVLKAILLPNRVARHRQHDLMLLLPSALNTFIGWFLLLFSYSGYQIQSPGGDRPFLRGVQDCGRRRGEPWCATRSRAA